MVTETAHTRIVRGARIALPVVALALLSMLFLLARSVNPDDAIPFADVDLSERARDQQLTAPRLAGVSDDGTQFALLADRALPDPENARRMTAEDVNLELTGTDGGAATVDADLGDVDTASRDVLLTGDVRVATSTGFTLNTPRLEGTLGALNVRASEGVTGEGPLGDLRAGEMILNEDEEGRQRMVFTGGVDLLYTPPTE